jgi:hypothetical protein
MEKKVVLSAAEKIRTIAPVRFAPPPAPTLNTARLVELDWEPS